MQINQSELLFADKSVTYAQFLADVTRQVVEAVRQGIYHETPTISQRQAFIRYGRANVERWQKSGRLKPACVTPGKKMFNVNELEQLISITQNYLIR